MKKKFKLGVIGAGFMASAIINGVITSKTLETQDIIVSDINDEALKKKSEIGINVTKDNSFLMENSEFVLFAVKPQNFSCIADDVKNTVNGKFISIMAGVKKDSIKSKFPSSKVARCMPNTPCSIGAGAVGIDLSDYSDADDINFIKNLFTALADVVCVCEDKLNAVTGVSGSSPAYYYLFLKGIISAGVSHGLDEESAKRLAVNTMIGAGKMVLQNPDKTLDDLIKAVCSKGGTTIEAVNVFNENNLNDITVRAVDACVKRSAELEKLI